jgi:lysophospholipase L1-like esterase
MNFKSKEFIYGLLTGFILALVASYSFFRIYWIMEVGVKYFRWHALLWLYLTMALLFLGISYVIFKTGRLQSEKSKKIYLVCLGIFVSWYLTEGFLRIAKIGRTYSEDREGVFVNPAERMQKTWYVTWQPNEKKELASGTEYSFPRTTNSLGLSDNEWRIRKDSNEIRVITLGDSFTEGDGCPFDSTYPNVLQKLLQNYLPHRKVNVMNAGRCGSDPWFEYKKLTDLLLVYKPDIVLYTNGSNDMLFDHLNYGGFERFLPDSSIKNRIPQPKWLGIYEVSYVFRLIADAWGYDNTLFSNIQRNKNEKEAIKNAKQLSAFYSQLAVQNNFTCIQLLRPDKSEMETGKYVFNVHELLQNTDTLKQYNTFDLLSYYKDSLHINDKNVNAFFWKVDQHHNSVGYEAMAKGAFMAILPMLKE